MLQLLSPLALAGLATLAIPALLHLWRPPAKTVRIGTLRFFTGPAVRRLTRLRWRERLLLLVRLSLFTFLVLLLARAVWKKEPTEAAQRWVLLEPNVVLSGEALKQWRDYKAAGFETRRLESGFLQTAPPTRSGSGDVTPTDLWSLLREADARLPAGSTIAVFATDQLRSLRGERPTMEHSKVEWITLPLPNESLERSWIESVSLKPEAADPARSLDILIGSTSRDHTSRAWSSVAAQGGKTALPALFKPWALEIKQNATEDFSGRLIRPNGEAPNQPWVTSSRPQPLRVAVLHSVDRAEDARYVEAAARALGEIAGRSAVPTDAIRADWIFWLSDQPAPPEILQQVSERGSDVLSEAGDTGAVSSSPSWFSAGIAAPGADIFSNEISLNRRIPPDAAGAVPVWTDGWGKPLLTVAQHGRGRVWRFFSRFDPEWNDLPQSSALPAAIDSLLAADPAEPLHDLRLADPSQTRPAESRMSETTPERRLARAPEIVDLHNLLWWGCAALFVLERVLSLRGALRVSVAPTTTERTAKPALAGMSQ